MPSKSLITSWTTSFVPSGTRFSHSRRKTPPGNSSLPSPRRRVLKRLNGLWKGTLSSRKYQLTGDAMLRRVSSTVSVPGMTLASRRPSPTPSSLTFSPPPTTPASLPNCADTDSDGIKFSKVEPRGILSDPFNDLYPALPFSGAPMAEPACVLEASSYCGQPVSQSRSLPGHSLLPLRASASQATNCCSTSGYTLDAATRLQDFRALVNELRDTLLHHDSSEESDTGNCAADDDEEERERLLRLLEDVMRKVQQLAENNAPRLGGHRHLSL